MSRGKEGYGDSGRKEGVGVDVRRKIGKMDIMGGEGREGRWCSVERTE